MPLHSNPILIIDGVETPIPIDGTKDGAVLRGKTAPTFVVDSNLPIGFIKGIYLGYSDKTEDNVPSRDGDRYTFKQPIKPGKNYFFYGTAGGNCEVRFKFQYELIKEPVPVPPVEDADKPPLAQPFARLAYVNSGQEQFPAITDAIKREGMWGARVWTNLRANYGNISKYVTADVKTIATVTFSENAAVADPSPAQFAAELDAIVNRLKGVALVNVLNEPHLKKYLPTSIFNPAGDTWSESEIPAATAAMKRFFEDYYKPLSLKIGRDRMVAPSVVLHYGGITAIKVLKAAGFYDPAYTAYADLHLYYDASYPGSLEAAKKDLATARSLIPAEIRIISTELGKSRFDVAGMDYSTYANLFDLYARHCEIVSHMIGGYTPTHTKYHKHLINADGTKANPDVWKAWGEALAAAPKVYTCLLSDTSHPLGQGFSWDVGLPIIQQVTGPQLPAFKPSGKLYEYVRSTGAEAFFNVSRIDYRPDTSKAIAPGAIAASDSTDWLTKITAHAAANKAGVDRLRTVAPRVGIYLEDTLQAGGLYFGKNLTAWDADNTRLAKLGVTGGADWTGVNAYLQWSHRVGCTPEIAAKLVRDMYRAAEPYGPRKVFLMTTWEFAPSGVDARVPTPLLRAQIDECRRLGVDCVLWNSHQPKAEAVRVVRELGLN